VLHGRDRAAKAILLLAHIDVVEARREDWERDPFQLVEENGWFYARGASDDKAMAAVFTDSLVRYRQEGFTPRRDIKLALTCGEETAAVFDSVEWLTQTHPDVLNALFALNEGAGRVNSTRTKSPWPCRFQAGEKVYQDFALEASDGRRPQLATDQEQSDNEARRRIGKARHVQFSDRIEPDDARLLRGAEQAGAAGNCRRYASGAAESAG